MDLKPNNPKVFGEEDYAPSTMTNRPLPNAPSAMTQFPINNAPSTMAEDPFNGTSSTTAENNLPATTLMTDPILVILEKETERSITTLPYFNTLKEGSAHSLGENHPAPVSSLTPFQIRPIPTMAALKTDRKHKRQKSEVLTSTRVKADQALKFKKANKKKNKISELAGPSKNKTKRTSIKQQNKKPNQDFYCLVCADKYTEPPAEDWIQCNECQSWAHEDCTSYVGVGSYFCDECED